MEKITTIEMHTGGEPLRIITGGYPEVKGDTILDKRNYAAEHLDRYRRLLIHEPRGHYDQYAALPVTPDVEGAHLAVLFMHNEGYSTMCGHAVIALARYAVDNGIVQRTEPETLVNIQCPCGLVKAYVQTTQHATGSTRFTSVPAFAVCKDREIHVPGIAHPVKVDVSYGGAFYALVEDSQLDIDLTTATSRDIADIADRVSEATRKVVKLEHPNDSRLEFLYGTIITRELADPGLTSNVCVFANKEIDRSPTGSGVTARVAMDVHKGLLKPGETRTFENALTGSRFTGKSVGAVQCGHVEGVRVEVTGRAYYTGKGEFTFEDGDLFPQGFLLR